VGAVYVKTAIYFSVHIVAGSPAGVQISEAISAGTHISSAGASCSHFKRPFADIIADVAPKAIALSNRSDLSVTLRFAEKSKSPERVAAATAVADKPAVIAAVPVRMRPADTDVVAEQLAVVPARATRSALVVAVADAATSNAVAADIIAEDVVDSVALIKSSEALPSPSV
jgi:hypothetical protein